MMRSLLLGAVLVVSAASCGVDAREGSPGAASVHGTTLDAQSGEPLAGVRVVGPGGVEAISDEDGLFRLRGLELGQAGVVRAGLEDGREAEVRLRPLSRERMEIVLRLEPGD